MSIPNISVPRTALIGSLALIGFTFGTIAIAKISDAPPTSAALPPVVETIALTFIDREDGAVLALDPDGSVRTVVERETGSFVRGVLRALVRERGQHGLDAAAGSFELNRLADGHLTITDPATQKTVDLGAFGPTNQAAFAAIMTPGRVAAPAEAAH